ncbi:Gfo/Idh/MocA family protein [Peribacillus sp. SCS-155]|uniref:Gfo/Idh/MocA family protein n=1 Tax=Peribacillus sedimenti TaxID=3115297 RepID=UPI003905CA41
MIKVGIIGLGAIGQRLIHQFNQHPSTQIAAVCDINQELAEKTAKTLGSIPFFMNHGEMLEKVQLDLVYVAVPPKYHHRVSTDVISKGIHILCEKPLANSLDEANIMLEQAQKADIVHAMNFPLNYSAGSNTFARLIKEHYVGTLRRLELVMRFPQWPRAWQQNEWVASKEQGGFVLEVGIHFIQQIQSIFGALSVRDRIIQFPEDPNASENSILATLYINEEVPFLIDGLSGIAGNEQIKLTAYGTEGTLSLVNWGLLEGGKLNEEVAPLQADQDLEESLIDHLVTAIQGKEATIIDFAAGYQAQGILEQLRK